MRRLVLRLSISLALLAVAAPAAATTRPEGTCVALGNMATASPIWNQGFGPAQATPWAVSLFFGTCLTVPDHGEFTATGTFTGWCDFFSGRGVTSDGHQFAFLGFGSRMLITGDLVGEVPFIADAVGGHSCFSGATHFLVGLSGAVLIECRISSSDGTLTTVSGVPFHYRTCA